MIHTNPYQRKGKEKEWSLYLTLKRNVVGYHSWWGQLWEISSSPTVCKVERE